MFNKQFKYFTLTIICKYRHLCYYQFQILIRYWRLLSCETTFEKHLIIAYQRSFIKGWPNSRSSQAIHLYICFTPGKSQFTQHGVSSHFIRCVDTFFYRFYFPLRSLSSIVRKECQNEFSTFGKVQGHSPEIIIEFDFTIWRLLPADGNLSTIKWISSWASFTLCSYATSLRRLRYPVRTGSA